MFAHYNNKIVNTHIIDYVACNDFVKHNVVHVYYRSGEMEAVEGAEAINLIMLLCPAVLEGMQAKHTRHSWAIHNLIGHPLMQILTWLGMTKMALWIHDVTVPPASLNENE